MLFTLEKSGEVRAFQTATGAQLFQSRLPGAVCIAPLGARSLVLGRLAGGALGSSLVRIDLQTGETAPLPGSETLTFALAPDPTDGTLYALGMSVDGRTTLSRYDGSELQSQTIVDSARGEYVSASLTIDPTSNYLYTSLGREVVRAWTGRRMEKLAVTARATLALCAIGGVLASLERDSSISLWDTATDTSFGGIYPFSDGSWAAVMADGSILGSREGRQKVGITVRGRLWDDGECHRRPHHRPPLLFGRLLRHTDGPRAAGMLRILLCDDHPILREGLKKILLQQSDIRIVEEAGSGAEMLEKSAASRFDVIILDITLPDMNGLDVLKNLQAAGSRRGCPRPEHAPRGAVRHARAQGRGGRVSAEGERAGGAGERGAQDRAGREICHRVPGRKARLRAGGRGRQGAARAALRPRVPGALPARLRQGIKEIALELGLSAPTIATYRSRVMTKLELASTVDLVRYALAHKLVE